VRRRSGRHGARQLYREVRKYQHVCESGAPSKFGPLNALFFCIEILRVFALRS